MYDIQRMESFLTLKERFMLEGCLAYAYELSVGIFEGKFKTLEELSCKITRDAERVSAALSIHLWNELFKAGLTVGLFQDDKEDCSLKAEPDED